MTQDVRLETDAHAMSAPPERPFYESFGWAYDALVTDPVEPWVGPRLRAPARGGAGRTSRRGLRHRPARRRSRVAEHEFAMRPWTDAEVRARIGAARLRDVTIAPGAGRPTGDRLLLSARAGA
jgi:hypothetical protein